MSDITSESVEKLGFEHEDYADVFAWHDYKNVESVLHKSHNEYYPCYMQIWFDIDEKSDGHVVKLKNMEDVHKLWQELTGESDDRITVESLEKIGFGNCKSIGGCFVYNEYIDIGITYRSKSNTFILWQGHEEVDIGKLKTITDLKTLWRLLTGEELTNETN